MMSAKKIDSIPPLRLPTKHLVRYLHVISSLNPEGGGPAEGVRQLTRVAKQLGHRVEIACIDPPDAPWTKDFDVPVHNLGPGYLKYGYAPGFVPWLRSNASRFEAVIINGLWQYHGFATWRALRKSNTPYFVFTHGMLDPWFKREYPLKHLKKWLYWPWADYRVLRDARAVLFTCEEERILARQSFALYSAREAVVSYGTPGPQGDASMQREAFLQRFPHLRDKRCLLFLSRLHPKKGCDILIEAFARVRTRDPRLHLVMAGPDQVGMQISLKPLVERLGIEEHITWTGMIRGDEKWGAFYAAEAFVLPSHQENFGIAVSEALACALPVLISNKVNIWREIQEDNAGLVAADTLEGTTQLLHDWLDFSPSAKNEMSQNALACFFNRFNIESAAQNLVETIEDQMQAITFDHHV